MLELCSGRDTTKGIGYKLGIPRISDKKSEVSFCGDMILYRYSFSMDFGLTIERRVLMLKKPALPTPSSRFPGSSLGGRVVRTTLGTVASGVRLKYMGFKVRGEVKSVT